jgi:TonB family protein
VDRYPQTEEGRRASQELGTSLKPAQELPYDVPPILVRIDTLECNEIAPVDSLRRLGVVTVRVFIDSLGRAGEAELVKGTGSLLCDDAALYAARMADYEAAMKDSSAVGTWLSLDVPFIPAGEESTGT